MVSGGLFLFAIINKSSEDILISQNSIPTYTPFSLNNENQIVKTYDFKKESILNSYNIKDTISKEIRTSNDFNKDNPYEYDEKTGILYRKTYTGRRINIAITGVDSRLNSRYKHADANHVISFLIDSGKIEITAIPRDTPVNFIELDSNQRKLNILRAKYGRVEYHKELARIAELDKIHYWVELGFSQAIGIIDWLGYKNPNSTLQVLRARKNYKLGDFQRIYNQANFIKKAISKSYSNYNGIFGDLILEGILSIFDSNLSSEKINNLLNTLKLNNFSGETDIDIRIMPKNRNKYFDYDFNNEKELLSLQLEMENFYSKKYKSDQDSSSFYDKLESKLYFMLNQAILDSAKNPTLVINKLSTLFKQKAWFQIKDLKTRLDIRNTFAKLLKDAYIRKNQIDNANEITKLIEAEDKLFIFNLNKSSTGELVNENDYNY